MTRVEVLERLAAAPRWTRVGYILRAGGTGFPQSLKTQLRRMANFGLVIKEKKLCPWKRDGWAYRLSKKGRARLARYGENGKLKAPWLKILRGQ